MIQKKEHTNCSLLAPSQTPTWAVWQHVHTASLAVEEGHVLPDHCLQLSHAALPVLGAQDVDPTLDRAGVVAERWNRPCVSSSYTSGVCMCVHVYVHACMCARQYPVLCAVAMFTLVPIIIMYSNMCYFSKLDHKAHYKAKNPKHSQNKLLQCKQTRKFKI